MKKPAGPRQNITVEQILKYVRKSKAAYKHEFNHGYNAGLEAVEVFITGCLANTTRHIDDSMSDCLPPEALERVLDDIENDKTTQAPEGLMSMIIERNNLNARKPKL